MKRQKKKWLKSVEKRSTMRAFFDFLILWRTRIATRSQSQPLYWHINNVRTRFFWDMWRRQVTLYTINWIFAINFAVKTRVDSTFTSTDGHFRLWSFIAWNQTLKKTSKLLCYFQFQNSRFPIVRFSMARPIARCYIGWNFIPVVYAMHGGQALINPLLNSSA